MSPFSHFTNQYSLPKTLRFELKPIGETQRLLEENNVFEQDRVLRDKYIKTKPFFDKLHQTFVKESLENFSFVNLSEYERLFQNFLSDKKNATFKKDLEKIHHYFTNPMCQNILRIYCGKFFIFECFDRSFSEVWNFNLFSEF